MGASFTKLFNELTSTKEQVGLLLVGLGYSGKTTILYKLKLGEIVKPGVTIGVGDPETLEHETTRFTVYDVGGQSRLPLIKVYIDHIGVGAVLYVVDSTDRERIPDAKFTLELILNEEGLRGVPLLVMANKQDLPDAMDVEEVTNKLGLRSLPHPRIWHVQSTSVITGEGLHEGLDWLASHVVSKK